MERLTLKDIPEGLLSYADAAEIANVSERTIRRRVASGEIRTVDLGRKARKIAPVDLLEWLNRNRDAA